MISIVINSNVSLKDDVLIVPLTFIGSGQKRNTPAGVNESKKTWDIIPNEKLINIREIAVCFERARLSSKRKKGISKE